MPLRLVGFDFFQYFPNAYKIPVKVPCKCYCVGLEEIGSRLRDVRIFWVAL